MRIFLSLFLMCWAGNLTALEDKTVNWATEEWVGYTDTPDGLYWQLIEQAFKEQGFAVKRTLMPFKRAVRMVDQKKADFTGGVLFDPAAKNLYIQAPFPITSTPISVFYRKSEFADNDINLAFIKQYSVVGTHQMGRSIGLESIREVNSKEQAFFMVGKRHADFFLDYTDQIKAVIKRYGNDLANFQPDDYKVKSIARSDWFMISPLGKRGEKIMQAYIAGSKKLYEKGVYTAIYEKSGQTMPTASEVYFKSQPPLK